MNTGRILNILVILLSLQICYCQENNIQLRIKEECLKKARTLGNNFSKISDKKISRQQRLNILNETCKMFESDSCIIEVSSTKRDSVRHPTLRFYLNTLMDLRQYNGVEMTWNGVFLDSDIEQNDDGIFPVKLKIHQSFKGHDKNGKILYEDLTVKSILLNVKVVLASNENDAGKNKYVIKFQSIKVIETINPTTNRSILPKSVMP